MLESLQYYNFKMGSHHASPEINNTPESNGAHFEHFRMSGKLDARTQQIRYQTPVVSVFFVCLLNEVYLSVILIIRMYYILSKTLCNCDLFIRLRMYDGVKSDTHRQC